MIRKDLEYVKLILSSIKNQDEHIRKAIAMIDRDLAIYDARRGQLKDNYETDSSWYAR